MEQTHPVFENSMYIISSQVITSHSLLYYFDDKQLLLQSVMTDLWII